MKKLSGWWTCSVACLGYCLHGCTQLSTLIEWNTYGLCILMHINYSRLKRWSHKWMHAFSVWMKGIRPCGHLQQTSGPMFPEHRAFVWDVEEGEASLWSRGVGRGAGVGSVRAEGGASWNSCPGKLWCVWREHGCQPGWLWPSRVLVKSLFLRAGGGHKALLAQGGVVRFIFLNDHPGAERKLGTERDK